MNLRILLVILLGCFVNWGSADSRHGQGQGGELTIDLFFILDKSMTLNYNENQTSQFLHTILTTAAPYFEKTGLGEVITLKLVGSRRVAEMDAQEFVQVSKNGHNDSIFRLDTEKIKHKDEGSEEEDSADHDHDHEHHSHPHVHVVLTGQNLSWTGSRFSKQKGLTNFQHFCDKNLSFALMQDSYKERTGLLLVHLLGHLLGLPHGAGDNESCLPVTSSNWGRDHDPEHADDHLDELDLEHYGGQDQHHNHDRDSTTKIPISNRTQDFWPLCTQKAVKTILRKDNKNVSCIVHSSAQLDGAMSKSAAFEISALLPGLALLVVISATFHKF